MGSGCCWVGRVVASYTRGPWFESNHQRNLWWTHQLLNVEETKIKKNEAVNGPFKKRTYRCWAYLLFVHKIELTISKKYLTILLKNGPFPASFSFIFVFSIQLTVNKCSIKTFADDLIRTADIWYHKRPFYQLSHNTAPLWTDTAKLLAKPIPILYNQLLPSWLISIPNIYLYVGKRYEAQNTQEAN